MKQVSLILSFLILFTLSFIAWVIVLGNSSLLMGISVWLPNVYMETWGKIAFWAFAFLSLGCSLSLLAILFGIEPRIRKHVVLEDESGAIGVSLDAIEDYIKRKAIHVDGVRDLHVRAEVEEGELLLRTKVVLELQRNVPEFTKVFQDRIYRELVETLGLSNVKEVQVLIHKLLPRESKTEPILLNPPASNVLLKDEEGEEEKKEDTSVKESGA